MEERYGRRLNSYRFGATYALTEKEEGVRNVKAETWRHSNVRCSKCKGPAEVTDEETAEGPTRTCRCLKGCQEPKTYRRKP